MRHSNGMTARAARAVSADCIIVTELGFLELVGEQTESRLDVLHGYSRRDTSEGQLENEDPDEPYGSAATDTGESVFAYVKPSKVTFFHA
jgi:hypothetical protein